MTRGLLDGNAGRLLVVLLPVVVYANSLGNPFHYDDYHSIVDNVNIRSLANLPAFFVDSGTFSAEPRSAMYRPLLLATFAINYAISGYEVWSYHLFGLLLHVGSGYLVMLIGIHLLHHPTAAVKGALIFALHPINSESVNYISSRSELASGFCIFLALWAFLRLQPAAENAGTGRVAVLASYIAGLLSKSVTIVLPAILFAYEVILLGRRRPSDWRLYGMLAAATAVYIGVVSRSLHKAVAGDPVRPYAEQLFSQLKALVFYLKLLLWPSGLNVDHQFQISDSAIAPFDLAAASAGLFCLSALYLLWSKGRSHRVAVFLLCTAILALLPSTLVPLNVLVNEHRLYVASAAFSLALAYAGERLSHRSGTQWRSAILSFSLLIVLALGVVTVSRNRVWASEYALWSDAAAKAPLMARPQFFLGEALAQGGEIDGAIAAYERAIARDESFGTSYGRLGELLLAEGRTRQALRRFEQATEVEPDNSAIWSLRGDCYRILARQATGESSMKAWQQALTSYLRALQLAPDDAGLHNNAGILLQQLDRPDEALAHHLQALRLDPQDTRTHVNIGAAHWELGDLTQAVSAFLQAVEVDPDNAMAWHNLATAYERRGQDELAAAAYERAAVLDSAFARKTEPR